MPSLIPRSAILTLEAGHIVRIASNTEQPGTTRSALPFKIQGCAINVSFFIALILLEVISNSLDEIERQ